MPQTRWVFLIGSLALVGIPPFAGFFSKDPIIAATLAHGGWFGYLLFAATIAGALLTGIYAFRLYFIVFTGEPSAFAQEHFHAHHGAEGPLSMRWTVGTLALLATVGGWLQFSPFWHPLNDWLAPVVPALVEPSNTQEAIASITAVLVGAAGITLEWSIYAAKRLETPEPVRLFERKRSTGTSHDKFFPTCPIRSAGPLHVRRAAAGRRGLTAISSLASARPSRRAERACSACARSCRRVRSFGESRPRRAR
jgi:NADH:ubiquinone oxidoreductase subunit 5 (subunit L)/multisubunit Na+/H+ antiporter MnhA subunit